MDFHVLFEQLIQKLNSQITINFEELVPYTTAVCRAIRVEKIVTTTYANAKLGLWAGATSWWPMTAVKSASRVFTDVSSTI